jgi:hypothetical protein
MKPLHEFALKLRKGPPLYMKCPCLIFPAWTKKRATTWTKEERKIPFNIRTIPEYVQKFNSLNHLRSA